MVLHITCIPGDGIGPEIVTEAKKVLDKIAEKYGHKMIYKDILMGGASIDVHGVPLTEEAIADAIENGELGGFGADVYSTEPFPEDHPFTKIMHRDNVCLTPHMAWGSYESRNRCVCEIADNIKSFFDGKERNRIV